jgi:hypothetical protein
MGGPIFGASGKINLAFYDALQSMSQMCKFTDFEDTFANRAGRLRETITKHLFNEETGILRMSDLASPAGICQDINAYGITTGINQCPSNSLSVLATPETGKLPLAFQDIEKWDRLKVVSPYATGFAAEALFSSGQGVAAIELIERVWGVMVDPANPNYSGGHWEAMNQGGLPVTTDCSLMHGWSTWPVFLLPQYLAGLQPLEPGWVRFKVQPVIANLDSVDVGLSTPRGQVRVSLRMEEVNRTGTIAVNVPEGTEAEIYAPEGWILVTEKDAQKDTKDTHSRKLVVDGQDEVVRFRICKLEQIIHWDDEESVESSGKDGEVVETRVVGSDSEVQSRQGESESVSVRRWVSMVAMVAI